MFKKHVFEKLARDFKILYDELVRVFYEHSFIRLDSVDKSASVVDHLYEGKLIFSADVRVVLAECGRDVNDTRTVGKSYVAVVSHVKRLFFKRSDGVREHRFVFDVFVFRTFLSRNNLVILEKRRNESFSQNITLAVRFDFNVIVFRVHAERDV